MALIAGPTNVIGHVQQCPDRHMDVQSPAALELNANHPFVNMFKIAIRLLKKAFHHRHEYVIDMKCKRPLDVG